MRYSLAFRNSILRKTLPKQSRFIACLSFEDGLFFASGSRSSSRIRLVKRRLGVTSEKSASWSPKRTSADDPRAWARQIVLGPDPERGGKDKRDLRTMSAGK